MPGLTLQLPSIENVPLQPVPLNEPQKLDISISSKMVSDSSNELSNLELLSLEPKKNKFIEETFEEYKGRKFSDHEHRLMFLFSHCSQEFENCEIKKIANSRNIKVYKEGKEMMELFNQEVFYYLNDKTVDFLQKYIPSKINEQYATLPSK